MNKYPNGKVHHIKYPYRARIEAEADKYLVKLRQATSQFETNNCFISLRNDMYDIFDEIFQRLYLELKENVILIPSKRDWTTTEDPLLEKDPCLICGECRIVKRCKIIPREVGGSDQENNVIYLCPTHRFLFENNKLSKDELEKIAGLINDKASDSIEYLHRIRIGGQS